MQRFHGLLSLGSGGWSVGAVNLLKKRLEEGLSISGGLQQSSQGMPEDPSERARLEGELEDIARDLVAALTGRRISFTDHLPYPWEDDFKFCAHGKTWDQPCEADERGRPGGCGRKGKLDSPPS